MASYSLNVAMISRGRGSSAAEAAAYINGKSLHDEHTGLTHHGSQFHREQDILARGILAPANAPSWIYNSEKLWNAAGAAEDAHNRQRKSATTARRFILALPHELTDAQRHELLKDFIQSTLVPLGMAVDYGIHAPSKHGDQRNFHGHLLATVRPIDENGFSPTKPREWQTKTHLNFLRERWADCQNKHLERAGHEARVDHRSYAARGIEKNPGIHLGAKTTAMERAGHQTERGDRMRDIQERNKRLQQILEAQPNAIDITSAKQRSGHMVDKKEDPVGNEQIEAAEKLRHKLETDRAAHEENIKANLERAEQWKTEQQRQIEKNARELAAAEEIQKKREQDGAIRSAEARWAIASGSNVSADFFTSFIRATAAASAAHLKEQQDLRAKIADPEVPEYQKAEMRLRVEIERLEYNGFGRMMTSGIYHATGGNEHMFRAGVLDMMAKEELEQAKELRAERHMLLARQREQMADKFAGLSKALQAGRVDEFAAAEKGEAPNPKASKPRTPNSLAEPSKPPEQDPSQKTGRQKQNDEWQRAEHQPNAKVRNPESVEMTDSKRSRGTYSLRQILAAQEAGRDRGLSNDHDGGRGGR